MRVGAQLLVTAVAGVAMTAVGPTRTFAQYVNPYTGNSFNNPISSSLDTMILHHRQRQQLLDSFKDRREEDARRARAREGQSRIARGQATTRFAAASFPQEAWLKRIKPRDPAEHERMQFDLAAQIEIWENEARARGSDLDDIGDSLALAFALAFEVYSGGVKAPQKAYRWLADDFRRTFLKDANFQGMSVAEKRELQQSAILGATAAVLRWQRGRARNDPALVKRAHDGARAHLARWWTAKVDNLTVTADRFITPTTGPARLPPAGTPDDVTGHQHDALMFAPQAESYLPGHGPSSIQDAAERERLRELYRRALATYRKDQVGINSRADMGRPCAEHDVARAVAYALLKSYSSYWIRQARTAADYARERASNKVWGEVERRLRAQMLQSRWLAGATDAHKQLVHELFAVWGAMPWTVGVDSHRDLKQAMIEMNAAILRDLGFDPPTFDLVASLQNGSFTVPFERLAKELQERASLVPDADIIGPRRPSATPP